MNKHKILIERVAFLLITAAVICAFITVGRFRRSTESSDLPVSMTLPLLINGDAPSFHGESASAAALIDGHSGALLYGKNESKRLPMASTTKIMTALVVLDTLPLDRVIDIPKEAVGVEGSSIYLFEHEKITVENLLYGLMLESGNDAATALAIACASSVDAFAEMMNKKALEIGLIDTHFTNPHGLSSAEHYTTAYELCFIAAEALRNPDFKRIVSTKKLAVKVCTGESSRYYVNHNKLLLHYSGAIGVKTGFTRDAGRCLVSAAERDGELYVAATLNDGSDWRDHTSMLDFAFENYDSVEIAAKDSFTWYVDGERYSNPEEIYLTVSQGETPLLSYSVSISENTGKVEYTAYGKKAGTFGISKNNNALSRK